MLQLPLLLVFFIYSSFSVVEAARFAGFAQSSGMPEGEGGWTSFFGQLGTGTLPSTDGTSATNSTQLLVHATATVTSTSTHVATHTLFIHGNSTSSTSTLKGNTSQSVTETTRTTSFVTMTPPPVTASKSFATIAPALATNPPASDTSRPSSPASAISDSGLSSLKVGIIVVSSIVALLIIPIVLLLRRRYKHKTSGFIADLMVRQHPSRVISPFVPNDVEAELTSPTAPSMQERQDTVMPNFTFVSEKHRIALDNALGRGAQSEMGTTTVSEKQHRRALEDALAEQEGNDIEATMADHTQRRTLGSTTSTARQIILQNQADSIRERIQVLQQASDPDSVQELDQLEMTLRDILDQMESAWALGLTDDPPPMYYYQTPPPSARFAPTTSSRAPSRPPSPSIRSLPPIPPSIRIHPPSVQSSGNVYTYL